MPKGLSAILMFVVVGVGAVRADASPSAFRALYIAGKSAPGGELVEISGKRGATQPSAWTFYYLDSSARGGLREIVVSNGEVESVRTPLRGYADLADRPPIQLSTLAFDSHRAFEVANHEAVKARAGFHWADYMLQAQTDGTPVWTVTLVDRLGVPVGSVQVSAETGEVLRPFAAASSPSLEPSGSSSAPVGGLIGDLRDLGIGIGTSVADTTLNVVGGAQEFLTGERTIGAPDRGGASEP
jgi:hypothetical protein